LIFSKDCEKGINEKIAGDSLGTDLGKGVVEVLNKK